MALLGTENLKRNIKIFLVVIFLAFLFWYSFSLREMFYGFVSSLESYVQANEYFGMAIFVGLGILAAMISPFSSAPLIPAAIVIWGNILTFFLLAAGWLIGAVITYYIGYSAGYYFLKEAIPFKKIEYYRKRLPEKVEFWLVLVFRLSMPAEVPGYTLGIIRYDFWKYFLATFISEVPFALISVYASEAFLDERPIIFISLIGFVIVVMSIMFYLFHKYLVQHKQRD